MVDTVIVGAGIIGLTTALSLARAGQSVVVIDRDPIGVGASSGNAGLLSLGHPPLTVPGASLRGLRWMFRPSAPLYVKPRLDLELVRWLWAFHLHCDHDWARRCMDVLSALGWRSMELFEALVREETIDCDFGREGWLDVALDPVNLDAAQDEARHLERWGFAHRRLDGEALREREPAFRREVAGAIHYPDSGRCHPGDLLAGLVAALERHGVRSRLGQEVTGFHRPMPPAVAGVVLSNGEIVEADQVVLAAGIWSDGLARALGVRVPMQPARGYHVELQGLPVVPRTASVLHETFIAATPLRETLRLAGTLEIAPLGRPWMRRRLRNLTRGATRYLHGVEDALITNEWAGYRPCTPDGLPVMGRVRDVPGLVVATGHAMLGLTLGPASGELVADIVRERTPAIDASLLRADRFQ